MSSKNVHRGVLLLLLAQVAAACAPRELAWEIDAPDGAFTFALRVVASSIHAGGCEGPAIYEATFDRGEVGPQPPRLGEGTYGFAAEGRTDNCVVVARGCTEISLPGPEVVVTTLRFEPAAGPACSEAQCAGGRCGDQPAGECTGCAPDEICLVDGGCAEACGDGACAGGSVCCAGFDLCCSEGCPPAGNARSCVPPFAP